MNDVTLHHGQKVRVYYAPTDPDGNPAAITGGALVADNDAVTVADASNPYGPNNWYVTANHLGTATLTATAKNSDGNVVSDSFKVNVTVGAASSLGVQVTGVIP